MIGLLLVLVAGSVGSSHCIGMCGPLAMALGNQSESDSHNLLRQLVYSAGRIFTYATLGAIAGFGGWWLSESLTEHVDAPAVLAVGAGMLLVYQGLIATGLLRWRILGARVPCLASTFLVTFLTAPGLMNAFLAGLFTGLLPCGLLYAFLTLAASTANMMNAVLLMIAFGAGTVPAMVVTGCGRVAMGLNARRRLYQIAAWCIVLTGVISIARGFGVVPVWG